MEKKILAIVICCFFSVTQATVDESLPAIANSITVRNCGRRPSPQRNTKLRVVGGKKTKGGQYPWMVSLHEDGGHGFDHVCGGFILNENWILTAAHCIDFPNNPSKYRAYAGLHKLSRLNAPTVQKIKISKIILHEDYHNETYEDDIALLKAAKPINIAGSDGYVSGICLPTSNEDPTGNAEVTGWGHTYQDGDNSDTLRQAWVPIIPRDLCNEAYDNDPDDEFDEITENMICAGMARRDSCQNDSGGPLTQRTKDGKYFVVGIVSHGSGCGERNFPGVYTKVSPYMQWILDIVSHE